MSTALVLTSSALAEASISNELVREAVAALCVGEPQIRIITRDLGSKPTPHLSRDAAMVLGAGETANEDQAVARALSDERIAELKVVDNVVRR